MAEEQLQELKQKLQQQEAEFQRYKLECKELETFLETQSNKKQQEIRKLKQDAIMKEKSFGPMKTQVSQLETENTKLKTEILELKQKQQAELIAATQKNQQYSQQVQEMKGKIGDFEAEREQLLGKIAVLQTKVTQSPQKGSKGKGEADTKKLQDAVASSKSKIMELQKQVQRLKEQLSKKHSTGSASKDIKREEHRDEDKLKQRIQRLEKKLSQSQSQASRAEEKAIKLSRQIKDMKEKILNSESERELLSRKVKQLMSGNSNKKAQREEQEEGEEQQQQAKEQHVMNSQTAILFSAVMLTKKHYVSPFLEFKNDNCIKVFKNTKNGCFEKSLGSIKCKLNQIAYNPDEIIEGCANRVKENLDRAVKCSIILFGSKKTTKKYLLANLIAKLKEFILGKIESLEGQTDAVFVKASADPEKKVELSAHNADQLQKILNTIIEMAQKSPKAEGKKKIQPKPKARYLMISHGDLYLEIITTSFTNIQIRENQQMWEVLNNIAYSRLPNAMQPTDCFRQIILTLNPIVSHYEDCKNCLSIINCKKGAKADATSEHELKASPIREELNDTARKKLESIERENEQSHLKIRRHEQEISFYKGKFDELELRLKNLLNTHREHNTYLKKSPVTLSYEKMLKFVHSVQSKNPSVGSSTFKVEQVENEDGSHLTEEEQADFGDANDDDGEGDGQDIL